MKIYAEIETGVPVPALPAERVYYPWREMNVGDSFVARNTRAALINNAKYRAERRTGYRFVVRRVTAGYRVWRIA